MKTLSIIDYEAGNLLSVKRAIEHLGLKVNLIQDKQDVKKADRIILPGVGAFGACMERFESMNLTDELLTFILEDQRPFLGICLGMQMMLSKSYEFGEHAGINIIEGNVEKISPDFNNDKKRIPHISWAPLNKNNIPWDNTILDSIDEGSCVYFVHSYEAKPKVNSFVLSEVNYYDDKLAGVIGKDNYWGCQFHPEKSGDVGLNILRNFVNL